MVSQEKELLLPGCKAKLAGGNRACGFSWRCWRAGDACRGLRGHLLLCFRCAWGWISRVLRREAWCFLSSLVNRFVSFLNEPSCIIWGKTGCRCGWDVTPKFEGCWVWWAWFKQHLFPVILSAGHCCFGSFIKNIFFFHFHFQSLGKWAEQLLNV